MSDIYDRKRRPLCIYQLLFRYTDDNHYLSMAEMISRLESEYGIAAERKAIYDDIKMLESMGVDINYSAEKGAGYSLLSRDFEISQLKLLVDTVQSSKFLTEGQSKELISKLSELTSKMQADQLKRHVYISGRAKNENKAVFSSVDLINRAINENNQITFKYFNWNEKKEKVLRHDGQYYTVSPWEMTISEEKYYLIGYDSNTDSLKNYRVDKMLECAVVDLPRLGKHLTDTLDLAEYTLSLFGMFGAGAPELVRISFPNELAGVIIDRFGSDVSIIPCGQNRFVAAFRVALSPQFFGWLFGLNSSAVILSPESAVIEYKNMLKNALEGLDQSFI